jgi:hypothetical protein
MLASVLIVLCLFHHHIIASNMVSEGEDKKELGTRMFL